MNVRNTSKAVHFENETSGFHETKRTKIFEFIYLNPGCSRSDIERGILGLKINCVCGRVNELLSFGHIYESGYKHDQITGRSVNRLYVGRKSDEFV